MTNSRVKRIWALGLGVVAVPVLVASIAYACTSLATLSMQSSGAESQTVSGTGKGFSTNATSSPVEIHFGSRSGQVVWTGSPSASGEIAYSFQVPQVAPGQYAIIATQTAANGNAVGGTPARAAFEVTGPPAAAAAPVQAAPVAEPTPAPAPQVIATPAAPVVRTPTPVVRTPARSVAPAPAVATPAPAPAPVAVAPAPVAPAPVAPAVEAAPAPVAPAPAAEAPATDRRSVMVSMAGESDGSPWLAIGLVGMGLALSLGATALVIAGRRDRKSPAAARR